MERVKKSLARLAIFSLLLILIMFTVATSISALASHRESISKAPRIHVLGLATTTSASVTPSPTPSPTLMPTSQPSPTLLAVADANTDSTWDKLAQCESGQNWGDNTGNGYYGGLQFSVGAWQSVGGSGVPSDASRTEQITRGKMLEAARGWAPWGACSRALGL